MARDYERPSPGLTAVNAFLGTYGALEGIKDRATARQDRQEDRALRRQQMVDEGARQAAAAALERDKVNYQRGRDKKADDLAAQKRADEQEQRDLGQVYFLARQAEADGKPLTGDELLDAYASTGSKAHLDPQMDNYLQTVQAVAGQQQDLNDPKTLQAFNWRWKDAIGNGVGQKMDKEYQAPDGQLIPANTEITGKEAVGLVPSKGGNGLYMLLRVTGTGPDPADPSKTRTYTWTAPRTKGSQAGDGEVLEIPLGGEGGLLEGSKVDGWLRKQLAGADPKRASAVLGAAYTGAGGDTSKVSPGKAEAEQKKLDAELKLIQARTVTEGTQQAANTALAGMRNRSPGSGGGSLSGEKLPGGTQQGYLEFLAKNVFGGSVQKAYQSLKTDSGRIQAIVATAKAMQDAEANNELDPKKRTKWDDHLKAAQQSVNSLAAQPVDDEPAGALGGAAVRVPTAADYLPGASGGNGPAVPYRADLLGNVDPSEIMVDAQGNRAVNRNGQWIELE